MMFEKMRAGNEAAREEAVQRGYSVEITENIGTSGFGTTKDFKFRWRIMRDGRVVRAGYAMWQRNAQWQADQVLKQVMKKEDKREAKRLKREGK